MGLALLFELAQTITEPRLLPVDRANLFQKAAVRIIQALHDRSHDPQVVAQAADLGGQPLQRLSDIRQIDNWLAPILAQLRTPVPALPTSSNRVGKLRAGRQ